MNIKTTILLFSTVCLMNSCVQNKEKRAEIILKDPVMQEEIFLAILNDSVQLQQFFNKMRSHKSKIPIGMHGRMMRKFMYSSMDSLILSDTAFSHRMMRHMVRRTDQDTLFCRMMSESILMHDSIRGNLMRTFTPMRKRMPR